MEPLITFYEAIMRKRWAELEIHRAERVWESVRKTFLAQVVGPHFESLCRDFALREGEQVFGDPAAQVGSAVVADTGNRTQIEIDVVALAPQNSGPRKVLSLGEAKWGEVMGDRHLDRLARARDLLARKGYDTSETVLACYGGAGFTPELAAAAKKDKRIGLVDVDVLYHRSPASKARG